MSCLLSSATQFRSNQIAIRRSEFIAIDHSEVHAISHSETGHFSIVMTAEFPIALTSERLFSSARNDYFHASESAEIPYTIENMGPLQNKDLCFCLVNTVRPTPAGPLYLPVTLRLSNRDGSGWAQAHELEHQFMCNLRLTFKRVELIDG